MRLPDARLEELLDRITPENLHGEIDTGPGVGVEAWGMDWEEHEDRTVSSSSGTDPLDGAPSVEA